MNCQPQWIKRVYNWLLSDQSCLLCDLRADTGLALCVACELELPWLGDCCQRCALPLPMAGLMCGHCIRQPPAFARGWPATPSLFEPLHASSGRASPARIA